MGLKEKCPKFYLTRSIFNSPLWLLKQRNSFESLLLCTLQGLGKWRETLQEQSLRDNLDSYLILLNVLKRQNNMFFFLKQRWLNDLRNESLKRTEIGNRHMKNRCSSLITIELKTKATLIIKSFHVELLLSSLQRCLVVKSLVVLARGPKSRPPEIAQMPSVCGTLPVSLAWRD